VPKTRACLQLEERNRIKRGTLFYHHVRSLRRNRSWRRINLCVPKIRFCNMRKPARCQRTSVFRANDHHGLEDRRTPTIKLDEQQTIAVRELDGLISHRNLTGQSRRLISMFLFLLLSPPGLDVGELPGLRSRDWLMVKVDALDQHPTSGMSVGRSVYRALPTNNKVTRSLGLGHLRRSAYFRDSVPRGGEIACSACWLW
jgi:hypothetical protein